MRLLLTRHGETKWNVLGKINGTTDIALTVRGEEQAHRLGERLLAEKIALVVSSPLIRAARTAEIVSEIIGAPLMFDERLREIDVGQFEGAPVGTPEYLRAKGQLATKFPGGESVLMVAHRIYTLLDDIHQTYRDKTILIICHGGICRVINSYFNDMSNNDFSHFKTGNCEIHEYRLTSDGQRNTINSGSFHAF
ncbi:MAG: histidine phosphatase family protein [Oscillospiraceae bacterium]